jgi:hypothetical protein
MLSVNPSSLLLSTLRYLAAQSAYEDGRGIQIAEAMLNGVLRIELDGYATTDFTLVSTDLTSWIADLKMFVESGVKAIGYKDRFFRKIAIPLLESDLALKDIQNPHRKQAALAKASRIATFEWKMAMEQFIRQQPEILNEPAARARRN